MQETEWKYDVPETGMFEVTEEGGDLLDSMRGFFRPDIKTDDSADKWGKW